VAVCTLRGDLKPGQLINFIWRNGGNGGGGEAYFCNLGKPETSSSRTEYYRPARQSSLKPGPSRVNGDEWDHLWASHAPRRSLSNNISTLPWFVGCQLHFASHSEKSLGSPPVCLLSVSWHHQQTGCLKETLQTDSANTLKISTTATSFAEVTRANKKRRISDFF
jgi:hypothetical protein